MNKDYIHITMKEDCDWQEVVINKQLQLHITTHPDGICIDYYRYRDEITDEQDDFLGSNYFFWGDLEDEEDEE